MNATMEKPLDYRIFLLGIVSYWLFNVIWSKVIFNLFFELEFVLNPIAVKVVESLLLLLVFYFLFRKPRMLNIRWEYVVGVLLLGAAFYIFHYSVVMPFLFGSHSAVEYMESSGVFSPLMQDVRKWANLLTSVMIIVFIWWRCNARMKPNSETDTSIARSYYGGMLFHFLFIYVLWLITNTAQYLWSFVCHPMLLEGICYLLLILVTVCAVWMLARKHTMAVPLIVILAIVAAHFFAQYYLQGILDHHFTSKAVILNHKPLFSSVTNLCGWAFFLAAFILYRKEVKRENKAVETDIQ